MSSINNYTCGKLAGCPDGKSTPSSNEKNDIGVENSEDESGGGDDGPILAFTAADSLKTSSQTSFQEDEAEGPAFSQNLLTQNEGDDMSCSFRNVSNQEESQLNISSINNYTCGKFAGCEDGGEDRKSTSSSDEKNDIGAKNSEDESGGGDDGPILAFTAADSLKTSPQTSFQEDKAEEVGGKSIELAEGIEVRKQKFESGTKREPKRIFPRATYERIVLKRQKSGDGSQ